MSKPRQHIVIVGLGQFGYELAMTLSRDHEVLALDRDEERVNAVSDVVQRALILDATDYAALSSVVDRTFDEAVVSIGESLEASILCTLHLRKLGIDRIRAKALNLDHGDILKAIGATEVVFPERESARRLAQRISHPNVLDFVPLAQDYQVMEIQPPPSFVGKSLIDLDLRKNLGLFVVAIKGADNFTFLPSPTNKIEPGDLLVTLGKTADLDNLQTVVKEETQQVNIEAIKSTDAPAPKK